VHELLQHLNIVEQNTQTTEFAMAKSNLSYCNIAQKQLQSMHELLHQVCTKIATDQLNITIFLWTICKENNQNVNPVSNFSQSKIETIQICHLNFKQTINLSISISNRPYNSNLEHQIQIDHSFILIC
jgi:hypothetical protein